MWQIQMYLSEIKYRIISFKDNTSNYRKYRMCYTKIVFLLISRWMDFKSALNSLFTGARRIMILKY